MSKIPASILIILLTSLLNGCNDKDPSSDTTADTTAANSSANDGGNVRPDSPDLTTTCYAGNLPGEDSAIELTIDKNKVTGYYAWSPHEKDGAFGKLTGTMDSGRISAEYIHVIEGSTETSEVAFALKGNTLSQGSGELIEKKGKLVFKDPSKLRWENSYEETDCNKVSKLISTARNAVK